MIQDDAEWVCPGIPGPGWRRSLARPPAPAPLPPLLREGDWKVSAGDARAASDTAERRGSARTGSGLKGRGVGWPGKARAASAAGGWRPLQALDAACKGRSNHLSPASSQGLVSACSTIQCTNINEYLLCTRQTRLGPLALSLPILRLSCLQGRSGLQTRAGGQAREAAEQGLL